MDAPALPPVQPRRLAAPAATGNEAAMRRAARDFETQAFGLMLQPMFATVDQSRSRFGGGAAEAQWRPMLVDAFAAAAVRSGAGLGLADSVLREMMRMRGATQNPNTGDAGP